MIVLGSFQVSVFFLLAVFETLGTILLCYSIAVIEGHVPTWLPMISDCAVLAPEKYPFRLGLIFGALLMEVEILLAYFSNKGYSNNNLSLIVGTIAAVGLGVVGAVNEQENNTIHSGCAVLFFFGYLLYMITMTLNADTSVSLLSISIKKICTIITGVALITFVCMSNDWSKYKLYIAICEWIATLSMLMFQLTFAIDLSDFTISETTAQNNEKIMIEQEKTTN